MKIHFKILFFILLVIQQLNSQNSASYYFFNNEYEKADSLYTLIIKNFPSGYHYFERANCRGKMANKQGYCADLAYACYYQYPDATAPFLKTCGKIDTVVYGLESPSKLYSIKEKKIIYSIDTNNFLVKKQKIYSQYFSKNIIDSIRNFDSINVYGGISKTPEYIGGKKKKNTFFGNNIKNLATGEKIDGRVYLKFDVYEDGSLHNIEILQGLPHCISCEESAQQAILKSPKWKPGLYFGRRVKVRIFISFGFDYFNVFDN